MADSPFIFFVLVRCCVREITTSLLRGWIALFAWVVRKCNRNSIGQPNLFQYWRCWSFGSRT